MPSQWARAGRRASFRVTLLCPLLIGTAYGQTPRPMTVDDVLALQSISTVAPSPNGEWLAVVIKRSDGPLNDEDADVWLMPRRGGSPRNLTAGVGRKMRWRNPVWSPDGARLALVSGTDAGSATPYIWTMRGSILKPLIDRDLDTHAGFDRSWPSTPMVWLDSVTVLGAFWEPNARPRSVWGSTSNTERATQEGWAKTEAGIEPAVSVLESGRGIAFAERPRGQLLRVDARTGKRRVIAEGYFWRILLSPTKRRVALIIDAGRVSPTQDRRLRYVHHFFESVRRTQLAIASLDTVAPVLAIETIHDPRIPEDGNEPHAWSPDGTTLAVVAKSDSGDLYGTTAFLVSARDGSVRQLTDRNLEVSSTAWTGTGTVLAFAQQTAFASAKVDTSRRDWWKFDAHADTRSGNRTNITSELAEAPPELQTVTDTNEMLGITGGHLEAISVRQMPETADRVLSDTSRFHDLSWWWPMRTTDAPSERELFVRSARGDIYAIGPDAHATPRLIPRPSADARLAAVDPAHHLAVFTSASPTGTMLWVGDGETSQFEEKITLNQRLREIAEAKRLLIKYVDADGDSLKGLVILPIGYVAGRRYPLITVVYGGVMIQDTLFPLVDKQFVSALNLCVLPAHGYALLIPSIPLSPEGEAGDPMIDIPKGVLAAVDEAARIGVADPARVGILGQSFGGYSTYSVITYSHRFRAAVAMAGFDDLASLYGDFDPEARYASSGFEMQHTRGLFENGQLRMGASPWSNLWRYLRNSPYYFADRVETPVMIIQGDMDYVGIEQGEEFFSALYRMGKPAKFVRYWGEGHVVERSPANVRDMWRRVFEWFDEHLMVEQRSANAVAH